MATNNFNGFNSYGYVENNKFQAQSYEVSISKDDHIISVTENGSLLASIKLGLDNQTLSLIGKDGIEFNSVTLPTTSTIESARYDSEKEAIIITVVASDGTTQDIEISFVEVLADYAKKADVEKNTQAIQDEATIRAEADAKFTEKDLEHDEALKNKVELTEYELNGVKRKAIVLNNYDNILGTTTTGGTVNIAMVSKWDKVDLGSSQIEINLNGSNARPTYNDEHEIALMDDISDMLTKTEASENYQPQGDYLTSIPEDYAKKTDLDGKADKTELADMATQTYATLGSADRDIDVVSVSLPAGGGY